MSSRSDFIVCSLSTRKDSYVLYLIFSLCDNALAGINRGQGDKGLERIKLYNRYQFDPLISYFNDEKIPMIRSLLKDKKKQTYIEIDPMFIYSSARIACDQLGSDLSIVHYINNIVDSSIEMCLDMIYPSYKYRHDALNLKYPANRIKPMIFLRYREFQHVFFRSLWHNLECYVRTKDIISRYDNIQHSLFFSRWLEEQDKIRSLMISLGFNMNNRRIESASKIKKSYDEMSNIRNSNITAYHSKKKEFMEKWTRVAMRFINRFGDSFQLTKEECVQLTEI